jgi:hypothetical protein
MLFLNLHHVSSLTCLKILAVKFQTPIYLRSYGYGKSFFIKMAFKLWYCYRRRDGAENERVEMK